MAAYAICLFLVLHSVVGIKMNPVDNPPEPGGNWFGPQPQGTGEDEEILEMLQETETWLKEAWWKYREQEYPVYTIDHMVMAGDEGDSYAFPIAREQKTMQDGLSWESLMAGESHFSYQETYDRMKERFGDMLRGQSLADTSALKSSAKSNTERWDEQQPTTVEDLIQVSEDLLPIFQEKVTDIISRCTHITKKGRQLRRTKGRGYCHEVNDMSMFEARSRDLKIGMGEYKIAHSTKTERSTRNKLARDLVEEEGKKSEAEILGTMSDMMRVTIVVDELKDFQNVLNYIDEAQDESFYVRQIKNDFEKVHPRGMTGVMLKCVVAGPDGRTLRAEIQVKAASFFSEAYKHATHVAYEFGREEKREGRDYVKADLAAFSISLKLLTEAVYPQNV